MQLPLTDNEVSLWAGESPLEAPLLVANALECVRNDTVLFCDLAFALGRGEILYVSGANGSGKTSLLRILCGLAQAEQGEVLWYGQDIQKYRAEYQQDLVYVAHANGIKTDLTPLENLQVVRALGMKTQGRTLQAVLERVGLLDYETLPTANLSSGQRRRLALARLLVIEAGLWILDEPFTSLDEASRQLVSNILMQHVDKGGSVILTSHEPVDWQDHVVKRIDL